MKADAAEVEDSRRLERWRVIGLAIRAEYGSGAVVAACRLENGQYQISVGIDEKGRSG